MPRLPHSASVEGGASDPAHATVASRLLVGNPPLAIVSCGATLALLISCGSPASDPGGGTGGAVTVTGGATSTGGGGAGTTTQGGSAATTGGTGQGMSSGGGSGTVSSGGTTSTPTGGTTAGGAPPNTGGASGGTPTSSGGASGATATGGKSATGTGGAGGNPQGGTAGTSGGGTATGGSGGAGNGDSFVSGVTVSVHAKVNTMLVVKWTQAVAADQVWLEFGFEAGNVMRSRAAVGTVGAHEDVVIGTPGATAVTVRIVSKVGSVENKTKDYMGTTKALPTGMPVPTIVSYDPALATADRYLFGAVENSAGGCTNTSCYYHTTFWLYIMDRKGRIVWYYADPASNATSSFQRIARDGEYIWIEKRPFGGSGTREVLKMTLDWKYSQRVPVPNLSDCIDVTTDGSLLYDAQTSSGYTLREMNKAGTVRDIWSCTTQFGRDFQCYSNTVNWNEKGDTVLLSFPEEATVVEVDRKTGALVGQYGDATGSYAFSPSTWEFGYQHFANITPAGTLLLSSHMPGHQKVNSPPEAGQHAFLEFEIDRANKRLVEKWVYNSGPEWAMYKGMAIRLPNGNTLGNYGTGGAIREITPDKKTAFHVKFDVATGNDFYNKMVGHNVLIDDLYALNGGGPK